MNVRRNNRVRVQPKQKVLAPVKAPRYLQQRSSVQSLVVRRSSRRRLPGLASLSTLTLTVLAVLAVLILASLNCAFLAIRSMSVPNQKYVVMVNRLPTLTPTTDVASIAMAGQVSAATAAITPTPAPIFSPSPTLIQNQATVANPVVQSAGQMAPTPTPTPWLTPTAIPTTAPLPTPVPTATMPPPSPADNSEGWSFVAMRTDAVAARNILMLYGEMINNTGTAQQVSSVTGTFYDSQGQIIVADESTDVVWPTDIIPTGGRMPFLLTVSNISNVSKFELSVQSKPVEVVPRQDFEFVGVNEQVVGNRYCLIGALKNPGGQLANYLVISGIFYDDHGNVLRFANDNKSAFSRVKQDEALNFKLCIKSPPTSNVASHKLLAWGS